MGELTLGLVPVKVANVDELAGLLGDALNPVWVGMTDGVDGNPAGEIKVTLTGHIPDISPLPFH